MIKSLPPKLAEIGKIKIGGHGEIRKTKAGKEFRLPVKFDYFVVTTLEKDRNDNFIPNKKIMDKLGAKPTEIDIILCYDNIEMNFLSSLSLYAGRKCACRGDGEKAIREIKTGKKDKKGYDITKPTEIDCPAGECEFLINKQCKPSGLLSVIIPAANYIGGVYKFRTTSWNSVQNISSSLKLLSTKTGGKLAGLPLKLQFSKKWTNEHGNVPVINIVFEGDDLLLDKATKKEIERREKFKIDILKIEQLAEKIGLTADNDDPADVESEFYNTAENNNNESKSMDINADSFAVSAKDIIDVETVEPEAVAPEKEKSIDEVL